MKKYLYLRESTSSQDSCRQWVSINRYLADNNDNIEDYLVFSDNGISGGSLISERTSAEIVKKLNNGDFVLVADMSRMSRNLVDRLSFISYCDKIGAKIFNIESNRYETLQDSGDGIQSILTSWQDSKFLKDLKAKTKAGIKAAHEKGHKSGRASADYGKGKDYETNKARGIDSASRTKINNYLSGNEWCSICKAIETVVPDIKKYQNTTLEYPRLGYNQFRPLTADEWKAVSQTLKSYEELLGKQIMLKSEYDYKYVMSRFKYPFGSRFRNVAENYVRYA